MTAPQSMTERSRNPLEGSKSTGGLDSGAERACCGVGEQTAGCRIRLRRITESTIGYGFFSLFWGKSFLDWPETVAVQLRCAYKYSGAKCAAKRNGNTIIPLVAR